MKIIPICILSGFLIIAAQPAWALDRWAALSLIESGNNDAAVGSAGEISRFQIKPVLWEDFYTLPFRGTPINPVRARHVAQVIMRERCARFENRFHRPPTDYEFYVLWNAPAQIQKPSKAVRDRARRFCNLTDPQPLRAEEKPAYTGKPAATPSLVPAARNAPAKTGWI